LKGIAILGSTGSIGASALEVVAAAPDRFRVVGLAAGRNIALLAEQVRRFRPGLVSVHLPEDRAELVDRLGDSPAAAELEILAGGEGAVAVASHPGAQVVLCAIVGAVGLRPTLAAIRRGATVAIANKEPLVVAGQLCVEEALRAGATLLPVDSEHSAIFQALRGHRPQDVRRLLLTGSGGPFRTAQDLGAVTVEQALAHPTWSMGPKISIDSATLMNKGLEVIEARWLFDVHAERIEVVIHPESIVHSMVEYVDGSVLAQLSEPDMRIPIAYALAYPERLALAWPRLELTRLARLTFEPPDQARFPCLRLAYQALEQGATYPAVLNAANEVAVEAFLQRRIRFVEIGPIIERTLADHCPGGDPGSVETLLEADAWARRHAETLL
jgi:1-deoxy-D-xylulose-5-phosphate reductoisomerase